MEDPDIIAKNVIEARKAKGWSVNRLAKEAKVKLNTIQAIEKGPSKGGTKKSKYLPDIARVLGVPLSSIDPSQVSNMTEATPTIPKRELIGARDLPIYATTEGGEGVLVMSSEPVDLGDRPTSLTHVKDAYGVLVVGESMVPVVRPGDIVAVHPHKHPRREDLCVFRSHHEGVFTSTIKEFVAQTADGWRVKRYKPEEKEFILKKKDWQECHVVVAIHRR